MQYGDKAVHTLQIDPALHSLIPALTPDEYRQLEENIRADGCTNALITWNGTIIDGHNRYEICHRHNIPFAVQDMPFESRDEAIIWIIKNQFGRRNLGLVDRVKLVLVLEPLIAEKAKQRQIRKPSNSVSVPACEQNEDNRTNVKLAKIAGVGSSSVQQYRRVQKDGTPEIKRQLDNKEITIKAAFRETNKPQPIPATQVATPRKYQERTSKETKAMIAEAVANLTDNTRVIEYTIENVIEEIRGSAETFRRQLQHTLQEHSDMLKNITNKSMVVKVLDEAITNIEEIRRNI